MKCSRKVANAFCACVLKFQARFTQDAEHLAIRIGKLWNTLQSMGVLTQLATSKGLYAKFACACSVNGALTSTDNVQVCECQVLFGRMDEGSKLDMPHFAGQRGPEVLRGLLEIETVFEKNLSILRDVQKYILDVKATAWHDDYNRYRLIRKGTPRKLFRIN